MTWTGGLRVFSKALWLMVTNKEVTQDYSGTQHTDQAVPCRRNLIPNLDSGEG